MDLGFNLNLEQKQQLVMTPRLQMAIELLQYSSLELEEYIEEKLEENPLLERMERDDYNYGGIDYSVSENDDSSNYENYVAYRPNLLEYLENQLYQVLTDDEIPVGKYIIGNLNQQGLLTLTTEEISENLEINVDIVESILHRVQYLDPIGIAAHDIPETLLIQLDSLLLDTDLAKRIVVEFYDELTAGKYRKIIKSINEDEKRVRGAINLIKTLNPHPASGFYQGEDTNYIIPDLIVREINGEFVIISNEKAQPSLKINQYYYKMIQQGKNDESHDFLEEKYRSALWLIKSIEQRRVTIYRIVEAIIKKQEDFFRKGVKHLSCMTMQDIADMINMHESTVSRATSGKYIQTPQGLFALKFFFNCGVENISSVSIKAIIADFINDEDPSSPLSDQKLADLLANSCDIKLSRRTIAKYRNEMGIPSSSKRRSW